MSDAFLDGMGGAGEIVVLVSLILLGIRAFGWRKLSIKLLLLSLIVGIIVFFFADLAKIISHARVASRMSHRSV